MAVLSPQAGTNEQARDLDLARETSPHHEPSLGGSSYGCESHSQPPHEIAFSEPFRMHPP